MTFLIRPTYSLFALILLAVMARTFGQQNPSPAPKPDGRTLQALVDSTVTATLEKFSDKKLQSNQLAVTLIDLRAPEKPAQASYRGDAPIYPASVIKLFYLVAAHHWMEDGKLKNTEELRRAMRDMIVDSGNDPTHYIVDLLTGTTGGPELSADEMKEWADKRNAVNRYFTSLGYTRLNINQKPWCEGPYGRERIFVGKNSENRNALTTDATARLLAEIVQGRAVTTARSKEMLKLMERDPLKKIETSCEPNQNIDFTGPALPPGAKLWSKAGWTSTTRHDAAYVELPNGTRFVLVTFTTGHANERDIIPFIARRVIEGMK